MAPARAARPIGAIAAVVFGLALLAVSVVGSTTAKPAVLLLLVATFGALVARTGFIPWRHALALLVLIILLIPIRRYAFPVNLPFQLEPYRLLVILLAVAWGASLLVDRRTHFRRTGFEGPLVAIVGSALLSVAANPSRIAGTSSEVDKRLMFLLSFVLVLYLTANVLRQFSDIDYLVKTLVVGGAIVALFAIVEARTGLQRLQPPLAGPPDPAADGPGDPGHAEVRLRAAPRVRVCAASDRAGRAVRHADAARDLPLVAVATAALGALCRPPDDRLRIDRLAHRDHDVRGRR